MLQTYRGLQIIELAEWGKLSLIKNSIPKTKGVRKLRGRIRNVNVRIRKLNE